MLTGCSGEDADLAAVLEGHGVKLLESDIRASIIGGNMDVGFVLRRTTTSTLTGRLRVSVRQLGKEHEMDSKGAAFTLDAAKRTVSVRLMAPLNSSPGALGGWVLAYSVELPGGTLRGWRSLYMAATSYGVAVVCDDRFAVGQKGVLRVIVSDTNHKGAVQGAVVTVAFRSAATGQDRTLAKGKTGPLGVFVAGFSFTSAELGNGIITVKAKAPPSEAYPYYTPEHRRVVETPLVTVTQ